MKQYAIYKGDKFLFMGTCKECAGFLKVKEKTITWYHAPASVKRDKGNRIVVVNAN